MNESFARQLRDEINRLERKTSSLRSELASLEGRLSGLRDALGLYEGEPIEHNRTRRRTTATGSYARASRVPDPVRSPGWGYVLNLLKSAPEQGYSLDFMEKSAKQAGHDIKRNSLRSILSHAYREGIIERVSTGHYRAADANKASSDAGTSQGNGSSHWWEESHTSEAPEGSEPSSASKDDDEISF